MQQLHSPICQFFFRFLGWLLPLHLLVWCVGETSYLSTPLLNAITWFAAQFSSLLETDLLLDGNLLIHLDNGRYLLIDQSCSGLGATVTLIAGLLAFQCRKLRYFICTLLAVQLLNQLRITHLFYLIKDDLELFRFFHLYVWQGVNFIFASGFFSALLWRENCHASV